MNDTCQAESLDGHEHSGELTEYVGTCVRGHTRRGMVCEACARPLRHRGPVAVTCAECPGDDPMPRVLVPAEQWMRSIELAEKLSGTGHD